MFQSISLNVNILWEMLEQWQLMETSNAIKLKEHNKPNGKG
jgi:hypothetical protein